MRFSDKTTTNWNDNISKLTGWLVGFLALSSFVLSYEALWSFALDNGVTRWLAWLWPLALDFFVIVASLTILDKSLKREDSRYPWALVVIFTVLSVLFNAIHNGLPYWWYAEYIKPAVPPLVYILPPVALVLSFHLAMDQVRDRLWQDDTESVTDSERSYTIVTQEREQRMTETRTDVIDVSTADTRQLTVEERRQAVLTLANTGLDKDAIAEKLEVSPRTVYRDIKALNGDIKRD